MIIKSTDWNRTCIYIHFSTRERGTEREREGKSFGHVTINGRRLEIRTVWRRRVDYVYKHTHNISYWKMICARFTPITLFQTFWTTVFPNCLYLPFARSKFRFRFIISSPFPFLLLILVLSSRHLPPRSNGQFYMQTKAISNVIRDIFLFFKQNF